MSYAESVHYGRYSRNYDMTVRKRIFRWNLQLFITCFTQDLSSYQRGATPARVVAQKHVPHGTCPKWDWVVHPVSSHRGLLLGL